MRVNEKQKLGSDLMKLSFVGLVQISVVKEYLWQLSMRLRTTLLAAS